MARVVVVHVRPDGNGKLERTDTLAHARIRFDLKPRCGAGINESSRSYVWHDGPVTCLWCAAFR